MDSGGVIVGWDKGCGRSGGGERLDRFASFTFKWHFCLDGEDQCRGS